MAGRTESALLLTFARRGEEEAIREAVSGLREALPGARITAVGTPVSAPVLEAVGVRDVIVYGEGHGAREVVREVRERRPRAAGIVYGAAGLSGHLKLELVALGSGARRVYRYRAGEPAQVIGRVRLLWSVVGKGLGAGARLVVGAGVCGLALLWLGSRQMVGGGSRAGRA